MKKFLQQKGIPAERVVVSPKLIRNGRLSFDVMNRTTERYICTLRMPASPIFKLTLEDISQYILRKRSTLEAMELDIFFND
jgi:hypothetical protein